MTATATTDSPRATERQLRDLAMAFDDAGVTDRAERVARACTWAGRPLTSTGQLSRVEAARLAAEVRAGRLPAPDPDAPTPAPKTRRRPTVVHRAESGQTPDQVAAVAGAAAELPADTDTRAAPDQATNKPGDTSLPAGVMVCGGPVTPHDAALIRDFADQLDARAAADSAALHSPAAADPEQPAELPDPVQHATTPEEVEAAALVAVHRFHARAGVVPDPPDRAAIPPRVPVVLGPAPGSYCMPPPGTCYCRRCPHWTPLPPVNYAKAAADLDQREWERKDRRRRPR